MEDELDAVESANMISNATAGGWESILLTRLFDLIVPGMIVIAVGWILLSLIRNGPALITAYHEPYANRPGQENGSFRDILGTRVVGWSLVGLFAIAILVLVAGFRAADPLEANKWVMASVLPLVGTWVGTVLAYYFSKENFRVANQASKDLLRLTTERLAQTPVKDKMIPFADIVGAIAAPDDDLKKVDLAVLENRFETQTLLEGRRMTRLFILTGGKSCLGILHRSTWYEMKNVAFKKVDGQGNRPLGDLTSGTFGAILAEKTEARPDVTFGAFIVDMTGYVAESASLRDVKLTMERIRGCQDVLVTRSGSATEPILGWITSTEIAKALEA